MLRKFFGLKRREQVNTRDLPFLCRENCTPAKQFEYKGRKLRSKA
jgi:hypothetical protein